MKKAFKSILVFGCVAALAACSKEKEPGIILLKAGQHSITLSVDERPDTRVSYSHQEGESVYRFSWSEGDAIGVYVPGRETAVKYTIDEIDGRKATFKLAEDYYIEPGQKTVNIVYPFSLGNDFVLPESDSQNSFGLENMGQYTVLYAKDVPMTDGQFGDVKLKHATSYLHFPADFEFFSETYKEGMPISPHENNSRGTLVTPFRVFSFENLEPTQSDDYSSTTMHLTITSQGTLQSDVYIPFFVPEGGMEMQLRWSLAVTPQDNANFVNATYDITVPPQYAMMPGMVYTATATTFPSTPLDFPAFDPGEHYDGIWED